MNYEFLSETELPVIEETGEKTASLEAGVFLERAEQASLSETMTASDLVAGTPETDLENWHMQTETNSCAICCQEFVAEQLLDQEFSEEEMTKFATEQGWYNPETGTTISDVGKLLETVGLEVEREYNQTLSDVFGELENGHKVIVGVNNMILDNPEFAELPGYRANHAVEVIGVDYSNPEGVQVILNDSGVPDGKGRMVSAETFAKAWDTSQRFMVTAWKGDA